MDLLEQDPAAGYLNIYKDALAAEAEAFFENAVREGKIDPELNAREAVLLRKLLERKEHCSNKKGLWIFLLVMIIPGLIFWGLGINGGIPAEDQALHWGIFIAAAAGSGIFTFWKIIPAISDLSNQLAQLQEQINEKYAQIQEQLSPLFGFFDWDTMTTLFSKVITPVKFDKFLPQERLQDLRDNFGFLLEDEPESTLTGAHSGTFYGYPFVFTEDRDFAWGQKTWTGSITVHYRERVSTGDGKYVWVDRTQILSASVTKPYPEFTTARNFFFGHSGAPNLSFSREPSSLSGGKGLFNALGKKYKMRKLRKFEQDLTDDSQYTMVSNHEFEMLFQSENRDNEVEFRVLYTPLAQQYMVKLLNDKEAGFGDDFYYIKSNCVVRICSEHQNSTALSEPPFFTDKFDLKDIKQLFMERCALFCRSLYFTLAPLMLVPVYNEPRQGMAPEEESFTISPSEIEGAASFFSEHFAPPKSVTENIFNVSSYAPFPGGVRAVIESIGFAGVERTDYETRYGADGNSHVIPIPWIEYIPVNRHTEVEIKREEDCSPDETDSYPLRRRGILMRKVS